MACPEDCKTKIEKLFDMSIPGKVQAAVFSLLVACILGWAGLWFYSANTYASQSDMKESAAMVKTDLLMYRAELHGELREIKEELRQLNGAILADHAKQKQDAKAP
jgi:hypothetical protein